MSRISVFENICKGCSYCVNVCPRKVLKLSEDFNLKGYHYAVAAEMENCVGCGMCTEICPDAALELSEE